MPEDARERPAADRPGPEQSGATMRFAAAGGPGSAGLGRSDETPVASWDVLRDASWLEDLLLRGAVDATSLLAGLLLSFSGMVLAARRLSGAMTTPAGPAAILAASAVAVGLLLIADRGATRAAGWLARFGLVATVAAVALPLRAAAPAATAAAVVALAVAGLIVGLGASASAARVLGRRPPARRPTAVVPPAAADGMAAAAPAAAPALAWDDGVQQRFERRTLADGSECVRGRVRVIVATGSRLGVAHVGFCPPLGATPAVEATTDYDGVEAVVSAAEVLPWGVRIECRLDEPAEELIEIPVDVVATAPA
jgi:hypothetical protein